MVGPMGPAFADDEAVWNPVELTGTVGFLAEHPVLNVDGKTYLVSGPAMMYAEELEEGTVVLVRGQLVEDLSNELVQYNVDGRIMVEQAEINGEVVNLSGPGIGRGMARGGRMGGRMGGRGFEPGFDDDARRPLPRGRW